MLLLPQTVGFVSVYVTIVILVVVKSQFEYFHFSAKPVRYVLEMNQGWFARKNLKAGSKLGGAPFGIR